MKDGFYWYRGKSFHTWKIVEVVSGNVFYHGSTVPFDLNHPSFGAGEWHGPILPPSISISGICASTNCMCTNLVESFASVDSNS